MRAAHRVPCIAALATLVLSACGVERTGLQTPDLGPAIDGGRLDLGAIDLGNVDLGLSDSDLGVSDPDLGPEMLDLGPEIVDLGPPDLGPPDLGPRDMGPPDMGPPDLGPPDLGPPDLGPPSCAALYSLTSTEQLCAERATECEFYADLGGTSCDDRCSGSGRGTCIASYANGGTGSRCVRGGGDTCASTHNDTICVCTR